MKQVEYWRWRYRDRKTGQIVRTMFQMTVAEARRYPEAERIDGTMLLRDVEDDFRDTMPAVRERALHDSIVVVSRRHSSVLGRPAAAARWPFRM